MRFLLLASIIAIITFPSCKKVSSDDLKDTVPYYQSFTVRYDVDKNETEAYAKFKVRTSSGTAVKLEGAANVKANTLTPTTATLDPLNYKWTMNGLKNVSFLLTKGSGQTFTNNFNLVSIGSFYFNSSFPSSISRNNSFGFRWEGDPVPSGVTFKLQITGTDMNDELKTISKAVVANQINLSRSELQNFKAGSSISVTLTRNNTLTLSNDDAGAGGKMSVTMTSNRNLIVN